MRGALIILIMALSFRIFGAEDSFYQMYLSVVGTNASNPRAINSPLLVDTNNTALKLKNVAIDLERFKSSGEFAGLRLGMTMDEVVKSWGKPLHFHPHCGGGPMFSYAELSFVFKQNHLSSVILPEGVQFNHGLNGQSEFSEWEKALGPPTRRSEHNNSLHAWYE